MVTCIIEDLENKGVLYKVDRYEGNSLWLADDTTLIVNSIENMKTNIEVLRNSAREYGLDIKEGKSKIVQVRGSQKPREICSFEVVNEVKYLGMKLGGRGRNIFREEKRAWMKKAQINAAQLMAQVGRIYDRITMGKAMWKQVMVTALLFGKAIVFTTKKQLLRKCKP